MGKIKLAIIYYSATGINFQLASWAEKAALAAGAEVRLRRIEETAPAQAIDANPLWRSHYDSTQDVQIAGSEDLDWADAIIFSVPTRFGNLAAQAKQFLDMQGPLWAQGKLQNKVVSGMTSAQNAHGGQEATLLALYTTMFHWGALVAAPGYTDKSIYEAGGNPYGLSVTQDEKGQMVGDVQEAVAYQAKRTVKIAAQLRAGKEAGNILN